MTDLRQMFDDASRNAPPDRIDLDAVVARGRGIRQRRRLTAAGSIAVFAVAAVVLPQVLPNAGGTADVVANAPAADQSYATVAEAAPEAAPAAETEGSTSSGVFGAPFPAEDAADAALAAAPAGYARADDAPLAFQDGSLTIPLTGPDGAAGDLVVVVADPCVATATDLGWSGDEEAAVADAVCAAYAVAGSPDLP